MATVVTLKSPQEVINYLNGITLPASWEVIDKGSRYTVIALVGASWIVSTVFDEQALEDYLGSLLAGELKRVVPKKEGGMFTFYSEEDVIAGSNNGSMEITVDEQDLADVLNGLGASIFRIIEHNSKKLVVSMAFLADPDAEAVFARMPTELTLDEKIAINNFVIAEKAAGNWGLYDEFYLFALNVEGNALTGWFNKTAVNGGAEKVPQGMLFNGTNFIDTNFNPAVDGVNYTLNDALIGMGLRDVATFTEFVTPMGVFHDGFRSQIIWTGVDAVDVRINAGAGSVETLPLDDDGVAMAGRFGLNDTRLYVNGILGGNYTQSSNGVPDLSIYVGAINNSGELAQGLTGISTHFIVGAAIGLDQVAHFNNIINLLSEL